MSPNKIALFTMPLYYASMHVTPTVISPIDLEYLKTLLQNKGGKSRKP